jgi:hypothetical protein
MAIGSCRRCRSRPRRMRRGIVEPLCEECYRRAMDRVALELAEEAAMDGRTRYRKLRLGAGARPADRAPERFAPVARAGARPLGGAAGSRRPGRLRGIAARPRTRCVSEELVHKAGGSIGSACRCAAAAETLLDDTGYANAHSAAVATTARRFGIALRRRRGATLAAPLVSSCPGPRGDHLPARAGAPATAQAPFPPPGRRRSGCPA